VAEFVPAAYWNRQHYLYSNSTWSQYFIYFNIYCNSVSIYTTNIIQQHEYKSNQMQKLFILKN